MVYWCGNRILHKGGDFNENWKENCWSLKCSFNDLAKKSNSLKLHRTINLRTSWQESVQSSLKFHSLLVTLYLECSVLCHGKALLIFPSFTFNCMNIALIIVSTNESQGAPASRPITDHSAQFLHNSIPALSFESEGIFA